MEKSKTDEPLEEIKNEFEDLDTEDAPEQEFSDTPDSQDNLIASGSPGIVYDYANAPEGIKAPPRENLDGQTYTLNKAEIILPPKDRKWELTRGGDKEFKYCSFVMHYDKDGQQEYYSGVRVFKKEGDMYSHPTMTRDRKNQASNLMGIYADFKKKDINEVSLKEFMSFLNSKPKVKIQVKEVTNPKDETIVKKNFIGSFVSG